MGLSNEERYEKIIFSISRITDLMENFKDYTTVKLKDLVNGLWFAFLKKESNGLMWLMGSDLASNHLGSGLLSAAFSCHIPNKKETLEDMEDDLREKIKFFDSYKTLSGFVEMDRLLEPQKRAVLLTYTNSQNIAYALCRYDDEFMNSYNDLNFLIRQIQGECFKLMKVDREYAYAWMVHHLCDMIYTMDENDIVNQWWTKQCIPHDIKLRYNKYNEVFEAFKNFQFRKPTVQDRIDLTFLLIAEKYADFEHQHKEFLTMVNTYNKVKKNPKIDLKKIEGAWVKAVSMKKEESQSYDNRSCNFTSNYVNDKGEVKNYWS